MDVQTIVTSTAAAVAVAALTGLYTMRAKQREYVNEYYKMVLSRRLAAYETVEELIISLKTSVIDADRRPYHFLFSQEDNWQSAYALLDKITSQALWLSERAFKKSQELNYLIFRLKLEGSVVTFGKENYQKISILREELERIAADDLLAMHDIKRFFRSKRKTEKEFRLVKLGDGGDGA